MLRDSEQLVRDALEIDQRELGPNAAAVGSDWCALGKILATRCKWSEAEKCFEHALQIDQGDAAKPARARDSSNLAQLRFLQKRFPEAHDRCLEALEIHQECHGARHRNVATDRHLLGQILMEMDHVQEALEYIQEAYATFADLLTTEHPATKNCEKTLRDCVQRAGLKS
jgi:tetratricopeptide (TPR) repeat protein